MTIPEVVPRLVVDEIGAIVLNSSPRIKKIQSCVRPTIDIEDDLVADPARRVPIRGERGTQLVHGAGSGQSDRQIRLLGNKIEAHGAIPSPAPLIVRRIEDEFREGVRVDKEISFGHDRYAYSPLCLRPGSLDRGGRENPGRGLVAPIDATKALSHLGSGTHRVVGSDREAACQAEQEYPTPNIYNISITGHDAMLRDGTTVTSSVRQVI